MSPDRTRITRKYSLCVSPVFEFQLKPRDGVFLLLRTALLKSLIRAASNMIPLGMGGQSVSVLRHESREIISKNIAQISKFILEVKVQIHQY